MKKLVDCANDNMDSDTKSRSINMKAYNTASVTSEDEPSWDQNSGTPARMKFLA